LGGIGALGEQPVSLGQLPDHLLRSVPLPLRRHGVSLSARSRGLQGLSQPMDRLSGVTPLAAIPVAPVQVWPRIPLQDLMTEMTNLKQIRLIRSDDPNAGGPIANVTVRDDISVDFAFDLPAV
jgi:hypothetical protein